MTPGTSPRPATGIATSRRPAGLQEAKHVFLEGNRLALRFEQVEPHRTFVIGETGFGTGLNFLTCWQHFDKYAPPDAALHFFSIEKHPLPRDVASDLHSTHPPHCASTPTGFSKCINGPMAAVTASPFPRDV